MTGLVRRREVLATLGAGALSGAMSGCSALPGGRGTSAPTKPVPEPRASQLAERFAPAVYFDEAETWFPTDPRPYVSDRDGRRVVHGFDAVEGYLQSFEAPASPPNPTVFYNARTYVDSPLTVVQFWLYTPFDQFTTNFHWHDWEVLHAFVDDDSGETQLYVASSHSRKVPNNEFLDPDGRPHVLSELGSHSSALSLNDRVKTFQRFEHGGTFADVTNAGIDAIETLLDFPLAYGLPRDEGFGLPYAIPELDGKPVHRHPQLPTFERRHLAPPELTVSSFADLERPPTDLPTRRTGVAAGYEGRTDGGFDVAYALEPSSALEDIEAFTGPQLSFSFAVPGFVEDAVAKHITSAGTPWKQERYRNPVADVTDPSHREELADRYEALAAGGPAARLVGVIRDVVAEERAPDGEGVDATEPSVEAVALVESQPVAVPSFRGVLAVGEMSSGDHRLTVNGAGRAPYTERVRVDGTATAGADGRVGLVANADAVKLRLDTSGTDAHLREFAVTDDFGGAVYHTRLDGPTAVYVHGEGAYTAEVRDAENVPGAFRVNPAPDRGSPVTIDRPTTGKASLAGFLSTISGESRHTVKVGLDLAVDSGGSPASTVETTVGVGTPTGTVEDGSIQVSADVQGLLSALEAVQRAATSANERARAGDRAATNRHLRAVRTRLSTAGDALAAAGADLPAPVKRALNLRLATSRSRTEQALEIEKL